MNASRARSRRSALRPTKAEANSAPTSRRISRSSEPITLSSYDSPLNNFLASSEARETRSLRGSSAVVAVGAITGTGITAGAAAGTSATFSAATLGSTAACLATVVAADDEPEDVVVHQATRV